MEDKLDRRTYDLLRLVDRHGPIGSIRLVQLMHRHGYEIKDRTIRLTLSELDDRGFTTKVPGKGRKLTGCGRKELQQGNVQDRLEKIRSQIATLTSRVSYDPIEDSGTLVVSCAFLDDEDIHEAQSLIRRLEALPFGPFPVALEEASETEPGTFRLLAPSSISLDGALLSRGVDTNLLNAGVVEYVPTATKETNENNSGELGGKITRHVDIISGEGSSIDVISLLIEAGRGDVKSIIEDGKPGFLVGDDREFPINRYDEARDLCISTRSRLGGTIDIRRPREQPNTLSTSSAWAFGSITYIGAGELLLPALNEYGLSDEWITLYGTASRNQLGPVEKSVPASYTN